MITSMVMHDDFPKLLKTFKCAGLNSKRIRLDVDVPAHLINHPTRRLTILVKNTSDVDLYIKQVGAPDANAMIFFDGEAEAFEFTPLCNKVSLELFTIAVSDSGAGSVYIAREG